MRNILSQTSHKVQYLSEQITPKLRQRFLFGAQAFCFRPLRSLNSNGRLTSNNRATGEMRSYRTVRDTRFLEIFPKLAARRINETVGEIRLSLDFSTFGCLQLAYLGLITGKGRTIPIWMQVHLGKPAKGSMMPKLIKGLSSFLALVGDKDKITITADRWFPSPKLLQFLDSEGVKFVIRIRSGISVEVPWDESKQKIYEIAQDDCQITHGTLRLRLIVSKWGGSMKQEEPWFLLTNDTTRSRQQILNLYKRRFEIEEMFKDLKWLLDYEWHQIKTPHVLEVLMWFVILGWWIVQEVLAEEVLKSRSRKVHPKKKLSFFASMQERLLQVSWPIELTYCKF